MSRLLEPYCRRHWQFYIIYATECRRHWRVWRNSCSRSSVRDPNILHRRIIILTIVWVLSIVLNVSFITLHTRSGGSVSWKMYSSNWKDVPLEPADGKVLPTSRRQEVYPNGTLVLHHVDRSTDHGAYTCTAKNKQSRSDSQTVHIEVKGKISSPVIFAYAPLSISPRFDLLKLE